MHMHSGGHKAQVHDHLSMQSQIPSVTAPQVPLLRGQATAEGMCDPRAHTAAAAAGLRHELIQSPRQHILRL